METNMAESRGGAFVASALVLVVAAGFALYAGAQRHGPVNETQRMSARFVSANGLNPGAEVVLAGVRVGTVKSIALNEKTQMADVNFMLNRDIHLPSDSVVGIGAPTMTSDNALQITPGHAAHLLASGETISNTRDQMSLEQQVSNYIFGGSLAGE
ncbi:organic solvent ABC transporter substrate-binding protein [Kozakia baliensis]|nr:organic solvent ABC transporter substrate-binding protein [Kozakia baliensis]